MDRISARVGEELASQISKVMQEFHYKTRSMFVRRALRHELKELELERRKDEVWHRLLSGNIVREKATNLKRLVKYNATERPHRPRLGLHDMLKHGVQYGQTHLKKIITEENL